MVVRVAVVAILVVAELRVMTLPLCSEKQRKKYKLGSSLALYSVLKTSI